MVAHEVVARLPRRGRRAIQVRENALFQWAAREWAD